MTGGASRLGRAIVLGLAEAGARPIIHFRKSAEEASETVDDARSFGVSAEALGADLSDPGAIESMFDQIRSRFGGLDILVNSAARFDSGPFESITLEEWRRSLDVNLTAPFLCAQHAARLMRFTAAKRGSAAVIINMVDLSGIHPWHEHVQHGVSKAGLIHLTRIMARELAPDVRVNAIVPGAILPPPGVDADDQRWLSVAERVPLLRVGSPSDVVEAIKYLVASDFVTGSLLQVDGGEGMLGPIGH